MKKKVIMFLMVLGMAAEMVACSANDQSNAFGNDPDSTAELTPQATLTPRATPAELTALAPEATLTPQASPVQIRLVNMSDLDFDNVSVNFLGQEVDYGAVPSGKPSDYQTAQQAYRYAGIVVSANGQTYEMVPIDYIGEIALAAGQYSYMLDIVDQRLQVAYLPDEQDKALVDADLYDADWYWVSAKKASLSLFPFVYEEHPSIRFTQDPDPNALGLHFEGYASCNWMGGPYHINEYNTLVVDKIGITERECEASDSETFFLDFLHGINYYSVEGDYLFLFSSTGDMMTFTRHQPTSEPPYATDSYAALAPIVQAIGSHARDVGASRLSSSSGVQWQIDFFDETVNVYVFDDATAAEVAIKSTFNDDSPEQLWQDERFLISYDGDYDLIDDVLNELFGKPLTVKNQLQEQEQEQEQGQEQEQEQEQGQNTITESLRSIASCPFRISYCVARINSIFR